MSNPVEIKNAIANESEIFADSLYELYTKDFKAEGRSARTIIPMFEFSRLSRMIWKKVYQQFRHNGWTKEEIIEWVQSKDCRHTLDHLVEAAVLKPMVYAITNIAKKDNLTGGSLLDGNNVVDPRRDVLIVKDSIGNAAYCSNHIGSVVVVDLTVPEIDHIATPMEISGNAKAWLQHKEFNNIKTAEQYVQPFLNDDQHDLA